MVGDHVPVDARCPVLAPGEDPVPGGAEARAYSSPAVWRGLVLVGSYDHTFYALEGRTGSLRWTFHAQASISGAASVIDGLVYFSSFDHRTYALTAAGGRLRAKWPDGEYSPAVAGDGRLYLVGLGRIYALTPAATSR